MSNRINFEKLNSIMRLFTIYAEQGSDKNEALNKAQSQLGSDYEKEFSQIKDVFLESDGADKNSHGASFFQSLKSDIQSSGGDVDKALTEVSRLMRISSSGFNACNRFYQAIYVYPLIIMTLAAIIYTFYKLFTFDTINIIFDGAHVAPGLSRFVFADLTGTVLLFILIFVVVFFIKTIITLNRNVTLLKPNNGWFSRVLFCGVDQGYLLFLLYLNTLLSCGSNVTKAIEKAKHYAGIHSSKQLSGYQTKHDVIQAVANENIATATAEVDFQLHSIVAEMEGKLISKQEKLIVFFQLIIFIFIGTMVVAMYLPIFKLGNMVS